MTVGRAYLMMYDQNIDLRKQSRCINNLKRLTEEDLIYWFDMCGCQFTDDQNKNTGSSDKITAPLVK